MLEIASTVVVDGYRSDETDFLTQLARVPDSVCQHLDQLIFFRLVEVLSST